MEITLNLDEQVVERARACAEQRQTTLDELVEQTLREIGERQARIDAWVRWTLAHAGRSEPGWRFNRDELYDRPILR